MSRDVRESPFGDRRSFSSNDHPNDFDGYDGDNECGQSPTRGYDHGPNQPSQGRRFSPVSDSEHNLYHESHDDSYSAPQYHTSHPLYNGDDCTIFSGAVHESYDNLHGNPHSAKAKNHSHHAMGSPNMEGMRTDSHDSQGGRPDPFSPDPDPRTAYGRARITCHLLAKSGAKVSESYSRKCVPRADACLLHQLLEKGSELSYSEGMEIALRTKNAAERRSYGDDPPVLIDFDEDVYGNWFVVWWTRAIQD